MDKNIFFQHLPKCGGTSIDTAFRKKIRSGIFHLRASPSKQAADVYYSDEKRCELHRFREAILLYNMASHKKYISGHFIFSDRVYNYFHDEYMFITILRDPLKRWISSYFYNRYKTQSNHYKIEEDLETYITSDKGKREGYMYVAYFCGKRGNFRERNLMDSAIANLRKYDIVATLDNIDYLIRQVKKTTGISLKIQKKNVNPVTDAFKEDMLTDTIKAQIRDLCKPDLEVYNYVKDNLLK